MIFITVAVLGNVYKKSLYVSNSCLETVLSTWKSAKSLSTTLYPSSAISSLQPGKALKPWQMRAVSNWSRDDECANTCIANAANEEENLRENAMIVAAEEEF